jgi:hypothetical protein
MGISQAWEIFVLLRENRKLVDRASQLWDQNIQALFEQKKVPIVGYIAAKGQVRKLT